MWTATGLMTALVLVACCTASAQTAAGRIQAVTGPVDPADLGPTLVHEHVLVDFIGADKVSPDRYNADEVFARMLPYLNDLKAAGIEALVECTPDYLGRDPALLRRLSEASGVRILTNTGWYKDPFLPAFAHEATVEEIAERWIREATEGIGAERIKPGFVKIAANEGDLSDIQRKIVTAAALTSKATGLAIASHTTQGVTALQELDVLAEVGVPASRFIWVHADSEPDQDLHFRAAERGAWIEYDGIREANADQKLPLVLEALKRIPDQLLISQDAGWYHVGEPNGGEVAPLDWLPRHFAPRLGDAERERVLVTNPARAFRVSGNGTKGEDSKL
jgi:phosphotriesterase-related protein